MKTQKSAFSALSEAHPAEMPAPTATHQGVTGCLFTEISVYLKAREPQCRVMAAPFAVFLADSPGICLQPDIVIVQDGGKLDEEGCHGAPDWVIEVVSESSRASDYGQKLGIYINAGVREYWIVDPEKKLIVTYFLDHPDVPVLYRFGDILKSDIYPDLVIDSSHLSQIRYKKTAKLREGGKEDIAAALAAAVRKALSGTDSLSSVPEGLVEEIVARELRAAGLPAKASMPPKARTSAGCDATGGMFGSTAANSRPETDASRIVNSRPATSDGLIVNGRPATSDSLTADDSRTANAGAAADGSEPTGTVGSAPGADPGPAAGGALPPALTDPAEVKAYILEHFATLAAAKNKGPLMKAAMSALKGRAEGKTVSEAVSDLCK